MPPAPQLPRFVVVLRAQAALRLADDDSVTVPVSTAFGRGELTLRTYYENLGDRGSVPRHLWCEVVLPAPSIDDALQHAPDIASALLGILMLTSNSAIDYPHLELAFDATPSLKEHRLWQQFFESSTGVPPVMRRPNMEHFFAALHALDESGHMSRLLRAIGQYGETLRRVRPGMEIMAVAHAWMAMEALTPIAREREIERAGSREDLLAEWGIPVKELDAQVRRRVLFQGDEDAYAEARKASDGLEHGYLDMSKIRKYSTAHYRTIAAYVRESVLRILGLEDRLVVEMLTGESGKPLACAPPARYLTAVLVGDADRLAHPASQYPQFTLRSSISKAVRKEDGSIEICPEDTFAWQLADGVEVRDLRVELWGP